MVGSDDKSNIIFTSWECGRFIELVFDNSSIFKRDFLINLKLSFTALGKKPAA